MSTTRLWSSVGRRHTIWLPPYIGLCSETLTTWLRPCISQRHTIWLPPYFGLYPVTSPAIISPVRSQGTGHRVLPGDDTGDIIIFLLL
ncbi:hypothetical protein DPMN_050081 [Dreissena polymorpha]|uniref:Uncharacterized protein n=1 Tax=Dreissena polymorpha TaxID=45954 RepID=A0A9D4CH46_DREPO|nr:hypothetical protein DPMN_050081 [Dreissena polymorpha]